GWHPLSLEHSLARSRRNRTAGSYGFPSCLPAGSSPILPCPVSPTGAWRRRFYLPQLGALPWFPQCPYGTAFAGTFLGFATAKLGTEMVSALVLARELRYARVSGYIEDHELRDNGRTRLTLRAI